MPIELKPAAVPAHLKLGFFGNTGTGKSWTAAKVLSQFIAEYLPGSQLAMFDTEPAAGYIAPMVKAITGKDLLAIHSRSFPDLLDFADLCPRGQRLLHSHRTDLELLVVATELHGESPRRRTTC